MASQFNKKTSDPIALDCFKELARFGTFKADIDRGIRAQEAIIQKVYDTAAIGLEVEEEEAYSVDWV